MKIHYLQHVPFEGLGSMESVLKARNHVLTRSLLYMNEPLPAIDDVDWLIVMGGPMGVRDDQAYPFLKYEKAWIKQVVNAGKRVLGICLGAQLIAHVLGAEVRKNPHREIGWFPITPAQDLDKTFLGPVFKNSMEVFHWHGDTFDIPHGAVPLGSSPACNNQGFIVDNRIVALQFHLETTLESAQALIQNCGDELDGSVYVQTGEFMISSALRFERINRVMADLLMAMESLRD
ncbi:MAG: type 1 glutamine amidotransferase [Proteobacteria bacterium]|nr:type 1 glutamine amidotransferase [Pseudomonadota bacterium]